MTAGTGDARAAALAQLTAPGLPLEIAAVDTARGRERVFVHAPATLGALFASSASDRTFIVYRDERASFTEVLGRAARLAAWLRDEVGVRPGERVAIAMRNLPEWVDTFMAAASMGAIAVALNALWEVDELEHALRDCAPRVLVVDPERLAKLQRCAPDALDGVQVAVVRAGPDVELSSALRGGSAMLLEQALAGAGEVAWPADAVGPDDPATLFYTSGSTGMSKGVLATHRQVVTATLQRELTDALAEVLRGVDVAVARSRRSVALLTVPLFHVTAAHAVFLPCFRTQCRLVSMFKWDPVEAARLIEMERVDWLVAPPAVTHDLVLAAETSGRDLSSLILVGGGGATRPPEQVRRIATVLDAAPSTGWGMTETNSIGTSISGADYLAHPDSCGRGVPVLDLRVVDADSTVLGPDEAGELQVRGTSVFQEYWNRPEATADAFDDGWFRTGDIARIDADGYVFIVDRLKDLIIRGGENIGCGQVEAALAMHPAVVEAVVYAVPDERLGEEVGATVFVHGEVTDDELREFVRPHLAHFAVPRWVRVTHEPLPRTASGKLSRREVRAAALGPA